MRPPFDIARLDHLVLRTVNVQRLVAFYETLGGRVVRRVDSVNLTQLRVGASMIDIVEAPAAGGADASGRNLDHFALRVDPFDESAILAFCAERGIRAEPVRSDILGADGYGPAVYIEDPDGNRVELKGPPVRPGPER